MGRGEGQGGWRGGAGGVERDSPQLPQKSNFKRKNLARLNQTGSQFSLKIELPPRRRVGEGMG